MYRSLQHILRRKGLPVFRRSENFQSFWGATVTHICIYMHREMYNVCMDVFTSCISPFISVKRFTDSKTLLVNSFSMREAISECPDELIMQQSVNSLQRCHHELTMLHSLGFQHKSNPPTPTPSPHLVTIQLAHIYFGWAFLRCLHTVSILQNLVLCVYKYIYIYKQLYISYSQFLWYCLYRSCWHAWYMTVWDGAYGFNVT